MFLANTAVSIGEAAVYVVLGMAVVFFGLILLMIVVTLMGKAFSSKGAKQPAAAPAAAPAASTALAPGSAGQLKLNDVEPKTAAMVMAIVADKLGKPLNELRFISIKEVK